MVRGDAEERAKLNGSNGASPAPGNVSGLLGEVASPPGGSGADTEQLEAEVAVEGLMDPCNTGGLNACATGVAASRLEAGSQQQPPPSTSASPLEDRWGKRQNYNAWQVNTRDRTSCVDPSIHSSRVFHP